jgi:hypothetical protein
MANRCIFKGARLMGIVLKTLIINILKEAEISVACLQDDNFESNKELDKDLEHISKQITLAINKLQEHA